MAHTLKEEGNKPIEFKGRENKILLKNHLRSFLPYFIIHCTMLGFLLFYNRPKDISFILIVMHLLGPIPMIILHIEYYIFDRSVHLIIDDFGNIVRYIKGRKERQFHFSDVTLIKRVSSMFYMLPVTSYWYYVIYLGDSSVITITSLAIRNLKIGQKSIAEEKVIIPLLRYD